MKTDWKNLKVGQTIILSDEEAVKDSLKLFGHAKGLSYLIERIDVIRSNGLSIDWYLYHLTEGIMVMAKMVGSDLDLRVYGMACGFTPGNRKDLLYSDILWPFEKPTEKDWTLSDLRFAENFSGTNSGYGFDFSMKSQGQLYGQMSSTDGFLDGHLAFIGEYKSQALDCIEDEMLITEVGGEESQDGGLITVYIGSSLNPQEIEVL
jgi:hypothetical protein